MWLFSVISNGLLHRIDLFPFYSVAFLSNRTYRGIVSCSFFLFFVFVSLVYCCCVGFGLVFVFVCDLTTTKKPIYRCKIYDERFIWIHQRHFTLCIIIVSISFVSLSHSTAKYLIRFSSGQEWQNNTRTQSECANNIAVYTFWWRIKSH